jgi:hypothetical protein
MIWVSKTPNGDKITAEECHGVSVTVATRGGEARHWRGCTPGDNVFARLVRAAREHCAA